MTTCSQCGKKINFFRRRSNFSGHQFCDDNCKLLFKESKKQENELRAKGMIKEIKCKCNQCGNIWHYLEEDEKKLKNQAAGNALMGCGMLGMCCSPFGAIFSNKSLDLQRELDKMKKCPKCNSTDIERTPIYHEQRT